MTFSHRSVKLKGFQEVPFQLIFAELFKKIFAFISFIRKTAQFNMCCCKNGLFEETKMFCLCICFDELISPIFYYQLSHLKCQKLFLVHSLYCKVQLQNSNNVNYKVKFQHKCCRKRMVLFMQFAKFLRFCAFCHKVPISPTFMCSTYSLRYFFFGKRILAKKLLIKCW